MLGRRRKGKREGVSISADDLLYSFQLSSFHLLGINKNKVIKTVLYHGLCLVATSHLCPNTPIVWCPVIIMYRKRLSFVCLVVGKIIDIDLDIDHRPSFLSEIIQFLVFLTLSSPGLQTTSERNLMTTRMTMEEDL